MPLAPLRLSTITVWPSATWSLAATSRAIMSTDGPGGTGTTMVMGLAVGQACANAGRGEIRHSPKMTAAIARKVVSIVRASSVAFAPRYHPEPDSRIVRELVQQTDDRAHHEGGQRSRHDGFHAKREHFGAALRRHHG